jgi:2-amino-4-hydroxy-6-hydroxymethyldihydropteridine diphosphokinase
VNPTPTSFVHTTNSRDPMVSIVLALGSNLGDRVKNIRDALNELHHTPNIRIDACSPLYESEALTLNGIDPEAPQYLNAVACGGTSLTPYELLDVINAVELAHGRIRTEQWGNRTLDIDIIVYGEQHIDDDRLTIPHPCAADRSFVLVPWLQIDPDAVVPGRGSVAELLTLTGEPVRLFEGHSCEEPL